MSQLSTSSSAVSREIETLRAEIRHLAKETKKKQSNLAERNSRLEDSISSERREKRDTERKLAQYAQLAERIKSTSEEKIRRLRLKLADTETELKRAKENAFNTETALLLAKEDSRQLEAIKEQQAQANKQLLVVTAQLEHERNERHRLESVEKPQHDFEADIGRHRHELAEKNAELEHLDARLRERSEKLAQALTRATEAEREKVKLQKRLDISQKEKVATKEELTDCRVDLERALEQVDQMKREVSNRVAQATQKKDHANFIEEKLTRLQADNELLHQEARVSAEQRQNLERKLTAAQEDAAIARITVAELEESLKVRVKQFDELKQTLRQEVQHDRALELEGLRVENAALKETQKTKEAMSSESEERLKHLEESLTRTTALNGQIQADYETNLVQTESLNKQLKATRMQLANSDSRLKEITLKLTQVDESKVAARKQADLLTKKLREKVCYRVEKPVLNLTT